ncbi:MAG TPA: amidohydrolase family protein [Acidimicrobiales bacterium]|nr:amidohydrolase family protein [Acidimicrobiales bacterium]
MHDLVVRDAVIVDGTGAPPRQGDVALDAGRITAVGEVDGRGRREIAADGRLLTPGWVDIHTHYDGQATWDPEMTPSSWHGVTTVVMGNCGVGFAPVRPGGQDFLIELMEGVEDIPGTALHEGIDWQWESFPQYLDALEATPRVLDVVAQVPHAALRAYVMGERAHEDATPDEVARMAALVEEALAAGAAGFTTSRTILHSSRHGLVPGTTAPADELLAIGEAMGRAGHGVFETVSDTTGTPAEQEWMERVARQPGITVTYALAQVPGDPKGYRRQLEGAARLQSEGAAVVPQVSCRPTGMLFGLQSSLHPFITHATYRAVADLTLAERVARLRQPEARAALLSETPDTANPIAVFLMSRWDQIFPLGDPPDYEPPPSASVAAVARGQGRTPQEVALDWLLERDGEALLFAPLASYAEGDFGAIHEMITHPATTLGLSDGGAHCGLICDASMPTYLLTHWARDRSRGEKLPLETAVHLQTGSTARVYGLGDRGTLEPGKRADLNLIDHEALRIHAPRMVFDLPAGGRRLVQDVDGYDLTIVAGTVTYENGEPTGERPGRLVRAGR